jgi:hypothetical protein
MFQDRGIVLQGEGRSVTLALAPAWQVPERLAQLAAEIDLYLR